MRVRPSEQQLARAAARLGDPAAGLTAVRELRRRLDTLEAAHVDQAIEAGWSLAPGGRGAGRHQAGRPREARPPRSARAGRSRGRRPRPPGRRARQCGGGSARRGAGRDRPPAARPAGRRPRARQEGAGGARNHQRRRRRGAQPADATACVGRPPTRSLSLEHAPGPRAADARGGRARRRPCSTSSTCCSPCCTSRTGAARTRSWRTVARRRRSSAGSRSALLGQPSDSSLSFPRVVLIEQDVGRDVGVERDRHVAADHRHRLAIRQLLDVVTLELLLGEPFVDGSLSSLTRSRSPSCHPP